MSKVARFELCDELYKLTAGRFRGERTGSRWQRYKFSTGKWGDWKVFPYPMERMSVKGRTSHIQQIPAYDADYIIEKLRNYDFTVVNLNSKDLSLTSESLEDSEGCILGDTLANLLAEFSIALIKEGNDLTGSEL